MSRALLVTTSFLPGRGGIETYLAALCDELGSRISVLAPGRRDGLALPAGRGYETSAFPGRLVLPGPRTLRAIEAAAARRSVDKLLFGSPWPLALLGPRLKRDGFRYAVIVHGAELFVPAAVPALRTRLARALAHADVLFGVSEFTAARIGSLLEHASQPLPPTELLRARVDLAHFRPKSDGSIKERLGLSEHHKIVLSFGRLVPRKGIHRLIDALPRLSQRVPEAVVVVAGTGPEEGKLKKRAAGSGTVLFAGEVSYADAPSFYSAADVFTLPVADRWFGLDSEGLGVALLEAQACATPCVAGSSGGTPEAVVDGQTGFVIDARDQKLLVEKIAWLLQRPQQARAMGAAGRAHVESRFARTGPPASLLRWLDSGRSI